MGSHFAFIRRQSGKEAGSIYRCALSGIWSSNQPSWNLGSDGHFQFILLGAYLVLLGISNIRDGILFDKDQQGQELKRRWY